MSWITNVPDWLVLCLAALIAWVAITNFREGFVPEFLDQTNVKRTAETVNSSYEQRTNHVSPIHGPVVPIQGTESPFRVNGYNAYIP